jgi:serine kinase of HPr protein (carbohydrate metabolism regulator)
MMMDVRCLIFTRSKRPTADMIKLAEENGIAVLCTEKRMYVASGILYAAGLGCEDQ